MSALVIIIIILNTIFAPHFALSFATLTSRLLLSIADRHFKKVLLETIGILAVIHFGRYYCIARQMGSEQRCRGGISNCQFGIGFASCNAIALRVMNMLSNIF